MFTVGRPTTPRTPLVERAPPFYPTVRRRTPPSHLESVPCWRGATHDAPVLLCQLSSVVPSFREVRDRTDAGKSTRVAGPDPELPGSGRTLVFHYVHVPNPGARALVVHWDA